MPRFSALSSFPLLPLTIAYIAGTIAGLYVWNLYIVLIILLISVGLIIFRHHYFAILNLAFGVAFVSASFHSSSDCQNLLYADYIYQGSVKQLKIGDTSQLITVEIYAKSPADSINLTPISPIKASVTLADFTPEVKLNDIITFRATFDYPTSHTDLPYEIDYASHLISQRIFLSTIIDRNNIIDVSNTTELLAKGHKIRQEISDAIYRNRLSANTKEILNTLITGSTDDLSQTTRQEFRDAGLAHILAVSGLHVGIIALILSLALWPMYALGHRHLRSIIILITLWSYCLITGFTPSVTRAVIMASVLITGNILQRRVSALNSLSLAALIILIFEPEAIISISFQMSFAAVAAILVFANALNPINQRNRLAYNTVSLITVSISAMLGTGLISVIYFHSLPVYFLLANIAVTLLLPPLLLIGILIVIISFITTVPLFLCKIADIICSVISNVAHFFSELPGATIDNIYLPLWIIIPYILFLITLKWWLTTKTKISAITLISTTLLIISVSFFPYQHRREPRIYIARKSYHTNMVIDRGTDELEIITTSWQDTTQIRSKAEFQYADFMGIHDIKTLKITPVNPLRQDTTILAGTRRITMIYRNPDSDNPQQQTDIIIICRGITTDIDILTKTYSPDSVILSYDLSPKRTDKYIRQLDNASLPYHSMRYSGRWSSPFTSR